MGGVMNAMQGGDYGDGFLSGAVGSIFCSAAGVGTHNQNQNIKNVSMVAAGSLSAGVTSAMVGDDFWSGFRNGFISSLLNHVMHDAFDEIGEPEGEGKADGDDPPRGKTSVNGVPVSASYPLGDDAHDVSYVISYNQAINGEFPMNWLLTRIYLTSVDGHYIKMATGATLGKIHGVRDVKKYIDPNNPNYITSWDSFYNELNRWMNWNGL